MRCLSWQLIYPKYYPTINPDTIDIFHQAHTTGDINPTSYNFLAPDAQAKLLYDACMIWRMLGPEQTTQSICDVLHSDKLIPDYNGMIRAFDSIITS